MSKIYPEILDRKRQQIFYSFRKVSTKAILIGGTALALQIKHRRSFDFDLITEKPIEKNLLPRLNRVFSSDTIIPQVDSPNELTVKVGEVKITYFHYPYPNLHPTIKTEFVNLYSLDDLASNKVHAIGRRGEWKDYVDLFFLLKQERLNIQRIIEETEKRFSGEFNEKLFWEQLIYWDDIKDFEIEFIGKPTPREEIQEYFKKLTKNRLSKI